jgi:chorismate mutase
VDQTGIKVQLSSYRRSIDNIDAALVHILAERFRCTSQVGELKARHRLPSVDKDREAGQFNRLKSLALEAGLDQVFIENLMRFIIDEVVRRHDDIAAVSGKSAASEKGSIA